jgi:hypothetical protein
VGIHPFGKYLDLQLGVVKLPFSILELNPTARFEFADYGPGNELTKDLGFAGHDIGAQLVIAPLEKSRWLRATLGAYRAHAHDEHASPLGMLGARVESEALKHLRCGVDVLWQPRSYQYKEAFNTSSKDVLPNPPDPLFPASEYWGDAYAASADVSFTPKRFSARAEGMLGKRGDRVTAYGANHFAGAWLILSHRFEVGDTKLRPAVRGEWFDADSTRRGGTRRALSGSFTTEFSKRIQLMLDVTHIWVEPKTPVLDPPKPFPETPYLDLDATRITLQLQAQY